jgi:hypothetical protein
MKVFYKTGIKSIAFSIMTALISPLLLLLLGFLFNSIFGGGLIVRALTYGGYTIYIAIACFFLCRKYPISVWYAPIICNASSIVGSINEPDFWGPYILYVLGWVVSLSAGILGSVIGHRRAKQV